MQNDELDILEAISSVLKSSKEIEKLTMKPLKEWPVYSATLAKCSTPTRSDGDLDDNLSEEAVYQSQELKQFLSAQRYYTNHYTEYCQAVTDCIKNRMNWSDVQVFRDIIIILATQGWQKLVDDEDSLDAVDRLATQFSTPLQGAGVQLEEIHAEFESVLEYSTRYISLSTLPYRASWWQIFHAPCASDWHNFLVLVELLFSLPSSNGKVERIFSQVDVIKTEKRTRLCNEALDLLMITANNVPLKDFNPEAAITLWSKEKIRRPNQKERRKYKRRKTDVIEVDNSDSEELDLLECWDEMTENTM